MVRCEMISKNAWFVFTLKKNVTVFSINSCMSLSRILLHLNDYSQALRVLEDGLATYVNDVRLYILRGIALEEIGAKFKQGDGKESALDCYEHVARNSAALHVQKNRPS